ncbi:MAG: ABC transporter substrate-binding protein [Planctomycetes bacterium]|nr:ABC transporter substrate-binding protein [Planctomycetota bacterium]
MEFRVTQAMLHKCFFVFVIFAAVVTSAGCGGCGPGDRAGTLIVGRGADSDKLDPVQTDSGEAVKVMYSIYDGLIRLNEKDLSLEPALATSWEKLDDSGLRWRFTLREGVKFHDGSYFNAEAVRYNFEERLMNADYQQRKGLHVLTAAQFQDNEENILKSVEVTGEYEVVFTLHRSFVPFLTMLSGYAGFIVSKDAAEEHDGAWLAQNPVGTGPFIFESWSPGDSITLQANKDYWGGAPKFDRLIFQSIDDNMARLIAFENEELDFFDGIDNQNMPRLRENENCQVEQSEILAVLYLAMNVQHESGIFSNPKVREAVAHALDKPRIVELYGGNAIESATPLPSSFVGFNDTLKSHEHDVAKAKALLAEAGYPEGFETTLLYMTEPRFYIPDPRAVAERIRSQLEEVGIRAKLEANPFNTHLPKVRNGEHQMCLLGWGADYPDTDNFLYTLFHSANAVKGSANNVSFISDQALDSMLSDARFETDVEKRAKLYFDAQARIHELVPVVPLIFPKETVAVRVGWNGFIFHPQVHYRFEDLYYGDSK